MVGDAFDRPCPTCEGIGGSGARAWLDWVQTYRRIEFAIADPVARLAALADHIRDGADPPPISPGVCPECDGSGRVLTEPGRELMEFLGQRLPDLIERRLRDLRPDSAPPGAPDDYTGSRPPRLHSV